MYPLYFNKPEVKKEELSRYGGKIQQGIGGYLLGYSDGNSRTGNKSSSSKKPGTGPGL